MEVSGIKNGSRGGPVVKTLSFHFTGHGFDPWFGKFCVLCSAVKKKKKREKDMEPTAEVQLGDHTQPDPQLCPQQNTSPTAILRIGPGC